LPYLSIAALRQAYNFTRLQDFLDLYYQGMAVLRTEEDFYDLAAAYLAKVRSQGLTHVEMFFDPQAHLERGIALGTVVNGLQRALDEAKRDFGISSYLIMCFLRHLDEDDAQATLDLALQGSDHRRRP
jgi:adenosine deaminase